MKVESANPITYQARWPDRLNPELKSLSTKVMEFFWKVISIILFPIFLIKLGLSMIRWHVYSRAVIPGHADDPGTEQCARAKLQGLGGETITITTPDGVKLHGAFFPGDSNEKAIIYGFGNGVRWETVDYYLIESFLACGASVLMVNPRSVGHSDRVTPDEESLALDIFSAEDFLRAKGYQKTLFMGQSMGGAYTTLGAAMVQEQYPDEKISAINIRSFSKLSIEVRELLKARVPHDAYCGFGKYAYWFAEKGIHLIGGELDIASAFEKLKGEKHLIWVESDDVIPYAAQMHPMNLHTDAYQLNDSYPYPHNRYFDYEETVDFLNKVCEILDLPKAAIQKQA